LPLESNFCDLASLDLSEVTHHDLYKTWKSLC